MEKQSSVSRSDMPLALQNRYSKSYGNTFLLVRKTGAGVFSCLTFHFFDTKRACQSRKSYYFCTFRE